MTEDEINVALAEAFGWREIKRFLGGLFGLPPDTWKRQGTYWTSLGKYDTPNFTADLNVIAEAESRLDDAQWLEYMLNLQDVLKCRPEGNKWRVCRENMSATARQKAEALVKTIGKWKN